MKGLLRRLEKLEQNLLQPQGVESLTSDELNVRILDVCFKSALSTKEEKAKSQEPTGNRLEDPRDKRIWQEVAAVLREIYDAHRTRSQPGYERFMVEIGEQWRMRHSRTDEYVPALLTNERDGFEHPNLMVRRAALRANPIVLEVLRLCDGPMPSWWAYDNEAVES